MANTWTSVAKIPTGVSPDTMILLTDGSVLVHNADDRDWYRLTPDKKGRYERGTWSRGLNMTHTRQFFASGVLKDGRVFAIGGEYSDAGNPTPLGEIFDPVRNLWSPLNKPAAFDYIKSDAPSCVLPDGRVLFGAPESNRTAIWDPAIDDWTEAGLGLGAGGSPGKKAGRSSEETWALLRDGTVLTLRIDGIPYAEKYVPDSDRWVSAGHTHGALPLASITDPESNAEVNISEIGPALTLPDGRCFFVGGTGRTALYTVPASPEQQGSWAAGPNLPADTSGYHYNHANGDLQTVLDGPAALLPDGRVLLIAGNTIREATNKGVQFWSHPCICYLFSSASNVIRALSPQPPSNEVDVWRSRLLGLPTGQVLFSTQQPETLSILTLDQASPAPNPAWRPTITRVPSALLPGRTYLIEGTQFNGLSQGSSYGDDAGVSTNYPIVRLTNTDASGGVVYLRTFNFSSLGIATGSTPQTASVQVPTRVPVGEYNLVVIANGIASIPISIAVNAH